MVIIAGGVMSCSSEGDTVQLASGRMVSGFADKAADLYEEATALEKEGRVNRAAEIYSKIAKSYPLAKEAPDARMREADILFAEGELIKAFDKYQLFITQYSGTSHYKKALKRQSAVAYAAATGEITNDVLGLNTLLGLNLSALKTKIPRSKVEGMLTQVIENAPFGKTAPNAQFTIGDMWEKEKRYDKAIPAYEEVQLRYPQSDLASEALFRVGTLLLKQTADGNHNRGNLDAAQTTFLDLIQLYPNSNKAKEAKTILKTIRVKDINRSMSIAEFYAGKEEFTSAAFYYQEVIRKTKSGSELNKRAKQKLADLPK